MNTVKTANPARQVGCFPNPLDWFHASMRGKEPIENIFKREVPYKRWNLVRFLSVHGKTLDTEVRSKLLPKQFASNLEKASFPLREAFKAILCSSFEAKKKKSTTCTLTFTLWTRNFGDFYNAYFMLAKGKFNKYENNSETFGQCKLFTRSPNT